MRKGGLIAIAALAICMVIPSFAFAGGQGEQTSTQEGRNNTSQQQNCIINATQVNSNEDGNEIDEDDDNVQNSTVNQSNSISQRCQQILNQLAAGGAAGQGEGDGRLAFTGLSSWLYLLFGGLAVSGGLGLMAARRRWGGFGENA